MIPISAICMTCTQGDTEISFPTVKMLVEHQKGGHKLAPPEPEKPVEVVKTSDNPSSSTPAPKKEPIILEYRYKGTHDCGNPLDTIQIPVGDKAMCVAYCPNCRIQVTSQEVIPIEFQNKVPVVKYVVEKKK